MATSIREIVQKRIDVPLSQPRGRNWELFQFKPCYVWRLSCHDSWKTFIVVLLFNLIGRNNACALPSRNLIGQRSRRSLFEWVSKLSSLFELIIPSTRTLHWLCKFLPDIWLKFSQFPRDFSVLISSYFLCT